MRATAPTLLIAGVFFACAGQQQLRAQMDQAEVQARKAEAALDAADREMDALHPDKADGFLKDAKERLSDPNIVKYPEHSMLKDRLTKAQARLPEVREEVRRREIEKQVAEQKDALAPSIKRVEAATESLHQPDVGKPQLDEAAAARGELKGKVDAGIGLETKHTGYRDYAAELRKTLASAAVEQRKAEKAIAFRDGPCVARKEALDLLDNAKSEKQAAKAKVMMIEALGKLRVCRDTGANMISSAPELAKEKIIFIDGKATSPDAVATGCAKLAASLEKKVGAQKKTKADKAEKKKKRKKK